MKWKLHRAIARRIADLTGLPEQPLVEGSISPDRFNSFDPRFDGAWKVTSRGRLRFARMSHHKPSPAKIFRMILLARRWLNAGDRVNAAFWLGRALHYVQDACTGKGFLGLRHGRVEGEMAALPLREDALRLGVENADCHPEAVRRMVGEARPSNKAEEALRRAAYLSARIAWSTVQLGRVEEAKVQVGKLRRRGRRLLAAGLTWSLSSLLLLYASAAEFVSSAFLPYAALGFLASLPLLLAPKHYFSRARLLAEWFALGES